MVGGVPLNGGDERVSAPARYAPVGPAPVRYVPVGYPPAGPPLGDTRSDTTESAAVVDAKTRSLSPTMCTAMSTIVTGRSNSEVKVINHKRQSATDMGGAPGYIDVTSPGSTRIRCSESYLSSSPRATGRMPTPSSSLTHRTTSVPRFTSYRSTLPPVTTLAGRSRSTRNSRSSSQLRPRSNLTAPPLTPHLPLPHP